MPLCLGIVSLSLSWFLEVSSLSVSVRVCVRLCAAGIVAAVGGWPSLLQFVEFAGLACVGRVLGAFVIAHY